MTPVLSHRQLNRATLARQLLLDRQDLSPVDAVHRIGGLQAQEPPSPSIALWARLRDFDPAVLRRALVERELVKATLLRITLHLVTADDYLLFRAALEPTLRHGHSGDARWRAGEPDFATWEAAARTHAATEPRSNADMTAFLTGIAGADRAPDLWWTLRWHTPFVHVPTDGVWSYGRRPVHADAEAWLGRPFPSPTAGIRHLVTRYLAAFGPASVADVGRWAGTTRSRVREGIASLLERPDAGTAALRTFTDEHGRELFDLEGAPLPHPDVPAPVRFVGMWENVLVGYGDRHRVIPESYRRHLVRTNGDYLPAILVDGMAVGHWHTDRTGEAMRVRWRLFEPVSGDVQAELEREADRLERFLVPLDPSVYAFYRRWWKDDEPAAD